MRACDVRRHPTGYAEFQLGSRTGFGAAAGSVFHGPGAAPVAIERAPENRLWGKELLDPAVPGSIDRPASDYRRRTLPRASRRRRGQRMAAGGLRPVGDCRAGPCGSLSSLALAEAGRKNFGTRIVHRDRTIYGLCKRRRHADDRRFRRLGCFRGGCHARRVSLQA